MSQTHLCETTPPLRTLRLSLVETGLARWRRWRADRQARTAFSTVLMLDDRLLHDMGVTRAEAEWAASLPLSQDAATAMHARAQTRRGRAP